MNKLRMSEPQKFYLLELRVFQSVKQIVYVT